MRLAGRRYGNRGTTIYSSRSFERRVFHERIDTLAYNAGVTLIEILAGFAIGTIVGMASA